MTIQLTPELEQMINERLERGQYKSTTELLERAFEALAERDNFLALRAREADEELASGDFMEYDENTIHKFADEVIAEGMARLADEHKTGVK